MPEECIAAFIEKELGISPEDIEPDVPFGTYGLSSVSAVKLVGILEDRYGIELSPTLVFEYPTVASLAKVVSEHAAAAR